jgi:hypothetical protein
MPRCHCNDGGTGGFLEAGDGIQITGDPTRRRTISPKPGPEFTGIVTGCVGGMLCRGLAVEDGCIAVEISTDPGNVVSIAPDGGLSAVCPDLPGQCGMTVRTLPAATFCTTTWGMGWNAGPATIPAYREAVSRGYPLSLARLQRLADGSFVIMQVGLSDSAYLPPSDLQPRQLTPPQVRSLRIQPDAAWGWCKPYTGLDTLAELLAVTKGRQVVSVEITTDPPPEGGTETITTEAVDDLLAAIDAACARRNVIVHYTGARPATELPLLTRIRDAGIVTGISISSQAQADRYPPAILVEAGVTWVYVHRSLPDAVFTGYKDAGLQVGYARALIQADRDRAVALGLRAVLADDPGYVCGTTCPLKNSDLTWCARALPSGQVPPRALIADNYGGQMGRPLAEGAGCGWTMPLENAGRQYAANLLGRADLPDPTSYTVTWAQMWEEADGGPRAANTFGIIIAGVTDELPHPGDQLTGPTNTPVGLNSGYVLHHQVGDPATAAATGMVITKFTKGAAPGPTAPTSGTRDVIAAGAWVNMRAIVTPTSITYQRLNVGGGVLYQCVIGTGGTADPPPPHRGFYVWAYKSQGNGTGTSRRLWTSYRNLSIT